MPDFKIKSESQRRKFLQLVDKGVISMDDFKRWDSNTDRNKLLPKISPKPKSFKVGKVKSIK